MLNNGTSVLKDPIKRKPRMEKKEKNKQKSLKAKKMNHTHPALRLALTHCTRNYREQFNIPKPFLMGTGTLILPVTLNQNL